jgi:hypothetical protein
VNYESEAASYYCWEYDDNGNWIDYKYYREPSDGNEYSESKEYTYNDKGEWTKCVTTINGEAKAIVLRTIEYLDK